MADEDDRALEPVDRLDQRLAAVDVEMVGGFVQHQDVRRLAAHQRQQKPGLLAAGQVGNAGFRLALLEAEAAQMGAHLLLRRQRHDALGLLDRGQRQVQLVLLVLGEIADAQLRRALHLAGHGLQPSGQQLDQRGLAVAVGAQQGDAVVHVDAQVHAAQDGAVAVADGHPVQRDQRRGHLVRLGEVEDDLGVVLHQRDGLQLLQRLQPALRLPGLGRLVAEAFDEGHHVLALGLLLGRHGLEPLHVGAALLEELVVVAGVGHQLALIHMNGRRGHRVQQVTVVADQQNRVGVILEVPLQPDGRLQIEVVGRLVEQEQVGPGEQHAGQRHAHPPAAREVGAGPGLRVGVEAQAGQDLRGARRRRMCLDVGQPGMNLADAHGVGGRLGLGQQGGALRVGGQDGVDQGGGAARGLLSHHADLGAGGHADGSGVRLELAGDELEEGGFPGAVAADQRHAVALRHDRGGAVEQHPSAIAERQVVDVKHIGAGLPRGHPDLKRDPWGNSSWQPRRGARRGLIKGLTKRLP